VFLAENKLKVLHSVALKKLFLL